MQAILNNNQKNIILTALGEYGISEITGEKHNARILEYFKATGNLWVKDDETAWCSAFISWVMKQNGLPFSNKLNARSWLAFGTSTKSPKLGDIVVLWRDSINAKTGHVGLYIGENKDFVWLLGGNQNNKICISAYLKDRVLDYRTF